MHLGGFRDVPGVVLGCIIETFGARRALYLEALSQGLGSFETFFGELCPPFVRMIPCIEKHANL